MTPPPPPPAAPSLNTPANGATGQAQSLSIGWSTASGATSYRAQISTSILAPSPAPTRKRPGFGTPGPVSA